MKIYVAQYKPTPEYEDAIKSGEIAPHEQLYDVVYAADAQWKLPYREMAGVELKILQGMNVQVGDHYCQLEVEQVGDNEFAIVCNDHPRPPGMKEEV